MSLGEGGVAGGVEGGVEGGVAGGIVGGLPSEVAPPPKPVTQVIRVGGEIREPKRIVYVAPEYPLLASQAGVVGLVILEAHVGTDGRVKDVTVLRSQPIFDDSAKAAVMQWRYQPLLLNGIAMEFVLSVTVQVRPPSPRVTIDPRRRKEPMYRVKDVMTEEPASVRPGRHPRSGGADHAGSRLRLRSDGRCGEAAWWASSPIATR